MENLIEDLNTRINEIDERLSYIRKALFKELIPECQIAGLRYEIVMLSGKRTAFYETIRHIQGYAVWNTDK